MASIVRRKNSSVLISRYIDGRIVQTYAGRGEAGEAEAARMMMFLEDNPDAELTRQGSAKRGRKKKGTLAVTVPNRGKGNKIKSDTSAGRIDLMKAAAAGVPPPPSHCGLPEEAWPFWESIMKARASSTWGDADLEKASSLAMMNYSSLKLSREILQEGEIIEDKANPKIAIRNQIVSISISLSRALHIDATATQGRSRDTGAKTKKQNEAAEMLRGLDLDLIPGLITVQ